VKAPSTRAKVVVLAAAGTLVLAAVAVRYTESAAPPGLNGADSAAAPTQEDDLGTGPKMQVLTNGHLSLVSRDRPGGPRTVTAQACDRAYAAGGTVACLRPVDPSTGTRLVVLDAQLHERRSIALTGFPNRTRVSPSGRMVAWTLFVEGHSYAGGAFSASTGILDTRTGTVIRSLEEFAVIKDGQPYRDEDLNFWGVTFADDNRFYASMATDGRTYLVVGDIAAGEVRTLAQGVECPSLSPDGTRVAFKHAIGSPGQPDPGRGGHGGHDGSATWRLSVLDLATMQVTHLAETRSVDDQAVWLDGGTVAYSLQRPDGTDDIWAVPADGSGDPHVLIHEANSPAPPVSEP
jgi:hypothetical protein